MASLSLEDTRPRPVLQTGTQKMRSMDLQEADQVLCLSLAYPGISNTLRYICYNLQTMVELVV